MKHKHLFKVKSVEIVEQDGKRVMEQMFGMKMPPLPKDKKWEKEKIMITKYICKCGKTQEFHDMPSGEGNERISKI